MKKNNFLDKYMFISWFLYAGKKIEAHVGEWLDTP